MTLDLLMKLQGMRTAVRDGHATIDEIFTPPQEAAPVATTQSASKSEALSRRLAPKASPAPEPPPAEDEPGAV